MKKKLIILATTLFVLMSAGIVFVNRVEAKKSTQAVHKENVKADNDIETNDDGDKYEKESKTEKISKNEREDDCQQDKEESENEKGDKDSNHEDSDKD